MDENTFPEIAAPDAEREMTGLERYWAGLKSNCLSQWLPKVQEAGVRHPRTIVCHLPVNLAFWSAGDPIDEKLLAECMTMIRAAVEDIGTPCFIRGGQTSSKHSWEKTCYLTDVSLLEEHVRHLAYDALLAGDLPTDVIAVRELIPTKPVFHAFMGMPITREIRLFADGKRITHAQPYWPFEAFYNHPPCPEWAEKMSELRDFAGTTLGYLAIETTKISTLMDGEWSIDWLQDVHGDWWCIDMARGEQSYRYDVVQDRHSFGPRT